MVFGMNASAQDRVIYQFQRTDGPVAEILKTATGVMVDVDPGAKCALKRDLLHVSTTGILSPSQVELHLEAGTGASLILVVDRALVGSDADPASAAALFMKWQAASDPIPDDTPLEMLQEYGIPVPTNTGDLEADREACAEARKRWIAENPGLYRAFREAYNTRVR